MRVFVGLATPVEVDDAVDRSLEHVLTAWARTARVRLRWIPGEQRHVTVRFVGECLDVDPLIDAVERAARGTPAPLLTVGPQVTRLTATALVLPVDGVDPLAAAIAHELRVPRGAFTGHVTVARVRRPTAPLPDHPPVTAFWTPGTLDVIESRPGAQPRFRTLAQAPLAS